MIEPQILNLLKGLEHHFEYKFLQDRRFRFDIAIPKLKIAIEREGGDVYRSKSRHNTGAGFIKDVEKYSLAASEGWLVIRYTAMQVDDAILWIKRAIEYRLRSER
jgi:hypothetical protein